MAMEKVNGKAVWRFIQLVVLAVIFATWWSFWLTSCGTRVKPAYEQVPENQSAQWTLIGNRVIVDGLHRYVDDKMDVICWLYISVEKAGLSCLPMSEVE